MSLLHYLKTTINFTSGKEIYVCEDCARTVKSIDVKRGALMRQKKSSARCEGLAPILLPN